MTARHTGRLLGIGGVAFALTLGVVGSAGAVHEGDYPGHIHAGSCEALGDVVFPLGNAVVGGLAMGMMGGMDAGAMDATPAAGDMAMGMGEEMGASTRIPVATSYTVVDAPLADILGGKHAINYHLSEDEIATYVACGDIGGAPLMVDGMDGELLIIGLRAVDNSDIAGVATLQGMGDQTAVTIFLGENLDGVE
jgi:hypothetical protein